MKVKVYPVKSNGNLLANASIEIESIVIKGFKIVEGRDGDFVSWPSQKGKDGKYYDQVYALNKDLRREVEDNILDEYENVKANEDKKGRRGRR